MPVKESDVKNLLAILPTSSFLRKYIEYGSSITDAHAVYHIGAALTLLSVTAPRSLVADFAGTIRPNIFTLFHGPTTESRKTTCVRLAREMLQRVDVTRVGPEPGSQAGLIESIRACPSQVIPYEEFGNFLAQAQEQTHMRVLKTCYNMIVDGTPLSHALSADGKERRTKSGNALGPVCDYNVSLIAACAPVLLEAHGELHDWTGGFLGRFLVFDAPRERFFEVPFTNQEARDDLDARLKTRTVFGSAGKYLGLTASASKLWGAYSRDIEAVKKLVPEEAQAALHRSQQHARKISMLLSHDFGEASTGGDWRISDLEITVAIAIAKMHVQSAIAIGQRLAISKDMYDRRRVLESIPRVGPVRFGDILAKAKLLKPRGRVILETLIEEGAITCASPSGSKSPSFIRVVPISTETDANQEIISLIGTGNVADKVAEQLLRESGASPTEPKGADVIPLFDVTPAKSLRIFDAAGTDDIWSGKTVAEVPYNPDAPVLD